ncbi:hypothetical protein [Acidisoma silvae]|uniref:DUF3060 domain-containing protein n=1 Tax=Acidisoma silvae TaxID=2802396 RepID=A0A963YQ81_9PROT|nr:hypothetical protein [Acidisoma silvae]MCB8875173.1 hypothetical protein [Acidisoma silvae]
MRHHLQRHLAVSLTIAAAALAFATGTSPARADGVSAYDGVYSGAAAPAMAISGCGQRETDIIIHVKNGQAWTHHHRLSGQVDATGNLSMQDGSGTVQITGQIAANNLTASETAPEKPKKLGAAYNNNGTICSYTISASRG